MRRIPAKQYKHIFESLPFSCAVLSLPTFKIIAVTDKYAESMHASGPELCGHVIYELYADDPGRYGIKGAQKLQKSLDAAVVTKKLQRMGAIRSDVAMRGNNRNGYAEMWWLIINYPVLDELGNVEHVIHFVEDLNNVNDFVDQTHKIARMRNSILHPTG